MFVRNPSFEWYLELQAARACLGRRQDLGSVWAQIPAALDACGHCRLAGGDYKVRRQFGGGLS